MLNKAGSLNLTAPPPPPLIPPPPPLPEVVRNEAAEAYSMNQLVAYFMWHYVDQFPIAPSRTVESQPGSQILTVYWLVPLPPEFLLRCPVSELTERYEITMTRQTSREIVLQFLPKHHLGQKEYDKVLILLDARDYHVKAIKLFDPRLDRSTVYAFNKERLNELPLNQDAIWDPPSLKGYRRPLLPN